MNEIEKKFFEAFKHCIVSGLSIDVINEYEKDCLQVKYIHYEHFSDDKTVYFSLKIESFPSEEYKMYSGKTPIVEAVFKIEADSDYDINGFKPDFIITKEVYETSSFDNLHYDINCAIEIDGHEWHEKTKEQASRDKQKDREYLKNGFVPIRFTGSDVYHDANSCVKDVIEIISEFLRSNLYSVLPFLGGKSEQ